jgi:cbb3-type cytochrome oxidase maturation protein
MSYYILLIPVALGLGLVGLAAFMWSLRSGQYDDLDGAAERILFEQDDRPLPQPDTKKAQESEQSEKEPTPKSQHD